MNKDVQNKIASCKALQGATVADICATTRFRENLAAYLTAQREDRKQIKASYEAMRKVGGAKGYKLPSHVIDRLSDLSVAEFANAYLEVINKTSERSCAEREYIRQLGQQAYNLTIAQVVIMEFPELEDVLLPKTNMN